MKKHLICLLCAALLALTACGQEAVPLTEKDIAQVNKALAPVVELADGTASVNELSCFFTSFYSSPEEINLEEFLRYCPLGTTLEDTDAEEFQAVMAAVSEERATLPSEYPVPVHRFAKEDVDGLLKWYADITVEDLSLDGTVYLEAYDAFYNFTSDFALSTFLCAGGERTPEGVRLWSEPAGEDGSAAVLTLEKKDGNYFIQSFETAAPEETAP